MAAKQVSLTLLVDKERNRVIYAESGKDFVEILLSFLTLPIGTVIKLSGKQSKIGSLTMLYKSLEDLDLQFLNTRACKDMLLHPKSSAEELYKYLPLIFNIGATNRTKYYICSLDCCTGTHRLVSTVKDAPCLCGKKMGWRVHEEKGDVNADGEDGVFIEGNLRFMITDDLHISVVSSGESFALLRELGISDTSVLEERNVNVGEEEVLHLYKRLLLSKTPLTDVFLGELNTDDGVDLDLKLIALNSDEMVRSQEEKEICTDSKKIMFVKLFLRKSNNRVLYAEGGEEFADILFSFLAFPLGFIVKRLAGCTGMGCLDNLYRSVEDLSFGDCMKSEESKAMLLNLKLAPYFGTKYQLIQIEEQVPCKPNFLLCLSCYNSGILIPHPHTCSHGRRSIQLSTVNQKFPNAVMELGGAFIAGPAKFMVTDELVVKPLSPISGISLLTNFNIPASDIEEQIVWIGEKEAVSLLKASLISSLVFSSVFCSQEGKVDGNKIRRINLSKA